MTWVSSSSEVKVETPGGTERVWGYIDRDVQAPDETNDVKKYRSFGAGNRYALNQLGKATLSGSLPVAITSGDVFFYLLANDDDSDSYSVSGSDPYTHVIKPTKCATTNPFVLKLTLDGCGATPDFLRAFSGTVFRSGTISGAIDEPLRLEGEIGSTGVTPSTGTAAATVATEEPFMFYMLDSDVSLMGETITKMESFQISWDNRTKDKWYFNDDSSRTPTEIVRGYGELELSANIVVDHRETGNDNTVYNLINSGTPTDVTIAFARGANDTITFLLEDCLLESAKHNLPETGDEISVPVTLHPETWTVTIVDDTSTYDIA